MVYSITLCKSLYPVWRQENDLQEDHYQERNYIAGNRLIRSRHDTVAEYMNCELQNYKGIKLCYSFPLYCIFGIVEIIIGHQLVLLL